ncbi:zinc finger protein 862-like [Palaemon carinicauda]|uniref:zinc finger protein 862-like n=1 Tax=Palaemon carinicauda TaxID=392227 RepID=UPI0035B573D1
MENDDVPTYVLSSEEMEVELGNRNPTTSIDSINKTSNKKLKSGPDHRCCVKESFLQFEAADKLDAESLPNTIFSCLDKFGLNYKSHLVGQGYDGASVMSGRNLGVAKRIKEICPTTEYIHCYAHRLNLVLVDSTKSVSEAADFFSLLEHLYIFISGSYVQLEMYADKPPMELQRLSDTRWSCRYFSVHVVSRCLTSILKVLDDITHEPNPDRSKDAS